MLAASAHTKLIRTHPPYQLSRKTVTNAMPAFEMMYYGNTLMEIQLFENHSTHSGLMRTPPTDHASGWYMSECNEPPAQQYDRFRYPHKPQSYEIMSS